MDSPLRDMEEEHPIVTKARLKAERAKRKADKARDEFFAVLRVQGTIVIAITTIMLALMAHLNK